MNELAYYEAVAQIIPVLLIVVAIEKRLLRTTRHSLFTNVLSLAVLTYIGLAEANTLTVLKTGEETTLTLIHTASAVGLLFIIILSEATGESGSGTDDQASA
jgi:hypothetical protein